MCGGLAGVLAYGKGASLMGMATCSLNYGTGVRGLLSARFGRG